METKYSAFRLHFLRIFLIEVVSQTAYCCTRTPLRSFQATYEMTEGIADENEVLQAKKSYLKEIKENKYPVILNMTRIFQEFLDTDLRPLIAFDNFQQINLDPVKYPFILRTPVPLVQKDVTWEETKCTIIMVSSTTLYYNLSVSSNTRVWPWMINLSALSLKLKTTNFKVHIGLYPPAYVAEFGMEWIYPRMFMEPGMSFRQYVTKPSYLVPVNGMVLLQGQHESLYNAGAMLRWISELQGTSDSAYTHDTFLILSSTNKVVKSRFEKVGFIKHIYVLQICANCPLQDGSGYGTVLQVELESFDYEKIQSLAFKNLDMNPVWALSVEDSAVEHLIGKAFSYSHSCMVKGRYEFWKKYQEPKEFSSLEWAALAHSHVWNSIMRNFTLQMATNNANCKELLSANFVITLVPLFYISALYTFPHYVDNHTNKLRIVGCGKRSETALPFQELVNIFDGWVWLAILVILVAFPLATKTLTNGSLIMDNFTAVVKVFLEQGDPFHNSVVSRTPNRIFIGLFLLMGIILSNAYKNTNVYNMVVPRKPVLYKYFHELIRDDFKIYTRSVAAVVEASEECVNYVLDPFGRCIENIEGNAYALVSEVEKLANDYENYANMLDMKIKTDPTLIANGLKDETRLHEHVISKFRHILLDTIPNRGYDSIDAVIRGTDAYLEIPTSELSKILQESVFECRGSAVILPEMKARDGYKELIKEKKLTLAFVGEELFSNIDWLFYLNGIIPPNLIERIHRIGESGVWRWWVDMFAQSHLTNENTDVVMAANLAGNIVIVFVVWGAGVGLALLCAYLEFAHALIFGKISITLITAYMKKLGRRMWATACRVTCALRKKCWVKLMEVAKYCRFLV